MRPTGIILALFVVAAIVPRSSAQDEAPPLPVVQEVPSPKIELARPVRLKAGEAFIDSGRYIAHSGPQLFDLDRDGKTDLLVGNFKGHIQVFRNVGTNEKPVYEDKGLLEAEGEPAEINNW